MSYIKSNNNKNYFLEETKSVLYPEHEKREPLQFNVWQTWSGLEMFCKKIK